MTRDSQGERGREKPKKLHYYWQSIVIFRHGDLQAGLICGLCSVELFHRKKSFSPRASQALRRENLSNKMLRQQIAAFVNICDIEIRQMAILIRRTPVFHFSYTLDARIIISRYENYSPLLIKRSQSVPKSFGSCGWAHCSVCVWCVSASSAAAAASTPLIQ